MRRATITLTDELEALLAKHLRRLDTPPSLNVLVQVALRNYLEAARPASPRPAPDRSLVAEETGDYEASRPGAIELDAETEQALRQAAAREGITASALAATVLRQYVRGVGRPSPRGLGGYRSGRSDVASRAEEILRAAARKARR